MEFRITKYIFVVWGFITSTNAVNFLPSIQWTPDNPIFKNLVGQTRKVNIDDEIRIWCPKYYTQSIKTAYQLHQSELYFALYKVETREEYDNCDARKGKRLLYCTDPTGKSTEDLEDRQIVFMNKPIGNYNDPYPAGNTYYFIGTSGGKEKDIDKKVGGKCQSDGMKFAIYVCREEENCSVDVLNGGWSLWKVNEVTGLCERNCTNPAPQNGGYNCKGPDKIECSKIISGRKLSPTTSQKSTTETSRLAATTKETPATTQQQTMSSTKMTERKNQYITASTSITVRAKTHTTMPQSDADPYDEEQESKESNDHVTLSMKGAVLTFIGLFLLGCVVGVVQILVILHFKSKQSGKQPEPQIPINHV